jgi:hypothetical protein
VTVYDSRVAAIRDYFKIDGVPPSLAEMKELTKEDRDELSDGIAALGHTIKGVNS